MKHVDSFTLPPRPTRDDGEERRVGFELEFSGIGLHETIEALQDSLGARVESRTAAECKLTVDELGTFNVELDWSFLKKIAAEQHEEINEKWIQHLSRAAALLVPLEVVCPPVPLQRLDRLQPMVKALRKAGAVGTEESFIAAYGVHINTEIPRLDATTLFAYLRAYAVLQWWLVDSHEVDLARRISPYIDLYPEAYLKRLLTRPTANMDWIFDDYLEHNPSRNRALDLLPMLAEIDEDRVQRSVDDPRVQARPAFHYRLPNCHIERPDWSLVEDWNTWLVVERLANRPDDLERLGAEFLAADRPLIGISRSDWVSYIGQWLQDQELA